MLPFRPAHCKGRNCRAAYQSTDPIQGLKDESTSTRTTPTCLPDHMRPLGHWISWIQSIEVTNHEIHASGYILGSLVTVLAASISAWPLISIVILSHRSRQTMIPLCVQTR